MKKIVLFFLSVIAITSTGFSENIILENQTPYPAKNQKSKIAIQWAGSAREVDEENKASMHGSKLNPNTVKVLNHIGKIELSLPKKAEYFRVLVWSKGDEHPDFLTNWVDVVPDKTYILKTDHLIPSALMPGMGC